MGAPSITLVCITTKTGGLRRFESGGERPRLTHIATPEEGPNVLTKALVESFRANPPSDFAVNTPPKLKVIIGGKSDGT